MGRTPSIRRFEPHEWRTYRDLRLRALAQAPDAFGSTLAGEQDRPDDESAERLEAGVDPRWNQPLLAEFGDEPGAKSEPGNQPGGLAWGRIERARPERADLYQMWVDPTWRRRGAARLLLESVIAWAGGAGARYLALGVTCGYAPTNRLYANAGFKPAGEAELLRPGSQVFAQAMELQLSEQGRAL